MTKKLTALEFERMERARLLQELRSKEHAHLVSQGELINSRQKLLEAAIKNLEIERHVILEARKKVDEAAAKDKAANEANLACIRKRLKIVGKFGYNPDSLEVVES